MSLWPQELKKTWAELQLKTKDNDEYFLNLAFAYTSRDEVANGAREIVEGVKSGAIAVEDIDEDLISDCLHTSGRPDPQVLLRTSGEVRFSDFLLWQISHSQIFFVNVFWPGITIWHLLLCVIQYQRRFHDLRKPEGRQEKSQRVQKFVDQLQKRRLAQIQDMYDQN
ncbi:Prenyltransf domain containing protein [Asbolus verrucosus]|uniref:Alkyl transferase n=1 Tax=Asbolus verrucosus TaxID=1661398 RepID=A0A482VQ57_ASBVE|nr:Prenyltransf domain containing protein [Asbolus verrucosus]